MPGDELSRIQRFRHSDELIHISKPLGPFGLLKGLTMCLSDMCHDRSMISHSFGNGTINPFLWQVIRSHYVWIPVMAYKGRQLVRHLETNIEST